MSHHINLKVLKKEDAIKHNIEYYELTNSGYVVSNNVQYDDKALTNKCNWLNVETDYFGGIGEQSSYNSYKNYDTINEGLLDVFNIKRTTIDQFDIIGLGKIRSNNDLLKYKKHTQYIDNLTSHLNTYIDNINVLNVYIFGSHVYGTNHVNSDVDTIIIAKEYFESNDINIHVYTIEQFQLLIDRHDIQALECLFAPEQFILLERYRFTIPTIDKSKLRISISTIGSNSWVKGKKKLTVAGDYDLNLALKSIFHSLRIIDFGIQIANTGKIQKYNSMNWLLDDLLKMSELNQREDLWLKIDDKYRKLYNSKSSEFKSLAPKDILENDLKTKLKNVLNKYHNKSLNNILLDEIYNEVLNIIEK